MNQGTIEQLISLAQTAGQKIIEVYNSDDFEVQSKNDERSSPLTKADLASHDILMTGLREIEDIPIVSEESADEAQQKAGAHKRFWLIDPLDGTKEFVGKKDEFTVNIAIMEGERPVFGLMYIPVYELCYWGFADTAFRRDKDGLTQQIHTKDSGLVKTVLISASHPDDKTADFITQFDSPDTKEVGSAYKLCVIAEGNADLYPRFKGIMDWDIAAGDAILCAAGGEIRALDGSILTYGKKTFSNDGFIAAAKNVSYDL